MKYFKVLTVVVAISAPLGCLILSGEQRRDLAVALQGDRSTPLFYEGIKRLAGRPGLEPG